MANSAQARKRARQNDNRRQHNAALRSKMRTAIKRVRNAIDAGEKEQAQEAFKMAVPVLDKMTSKGIVHKNASSRYKSRLSASIKAL